MNPDLLKILCCAETHQALMLADVALVEKLNQQIEAGKLCNRQGEPVKGKVSGALLRADGKVVYPIRDNLPILLPTESIEIS